MYFEEKKKIKVIQLTTNLLSFHMYLNCYISYIKSCLNFKENKSTIFIHTEIGS